MKKIKHSFIILFFLIYLPTNVMSLQGCCSHHNGVSNNCTEDGYAICNDDKISSCPCEVPIFTDGTTNDTNNNIDETTSATEERQCQYDKYKLKQEKKKLEKKYNKLKKYEFIEKNKIIIGMILYTITILISMYIIPKKIIIKNKILKIIVTILWYILIITFGWLLIPIEMMEYGYFGFGMLSILISAIIFKSIDE